jgi:hypothetical protein
VAILDDYRAIHANLVAELRAATARRVEEQSAGKGERTTYQGGNGKMLDWNGYLTTLGAEIEKWEARITALEAVEDGAGEPYELHTTAIPGDWF